MKKILLFFVVTLALSSYGQENESVLLKKNEIKGNALFLVLGAFEVTYEQILNDDSGIGVSLFFIAKEEDFDTTFSLSPYYRAYFGKKRASGFFVEGFSSISTGKNGSYSEYDPTTDSSYIVKGEKYTDLALGFGIGSKWVHKKGYIFEINAGMGRNLFSNNSPEIVGRGGITLGYRF